MGRMHRFSPVTTPLESRESLNINHATSRSDRRRHHRRNDGLCLVEARPRRDGIRWPSRRCRFWTSTRCGSWSAPTAPDDAGHDAGGARGNPVRDVRQDRAWSPRLDAVGRNRRGTRDGVVHGGHRSRASPCSIAGVGTQFVRDRSRTGANDRNDQRSPTRATPMMETRHRSGADLATQILGHREVMAWLAI